jgi:RNA polymerase sigma-70 factor (ECF subfamily)
VPGRQTDSEITDLLRHDRRAAFTMLLERYQNKVVRLAYSILGNRTLAEEAAQEAFVKVWKALPRYDGTAALSTWLYAIARNTCLDELRRNALRREMPLEEVGLSGGAAPPDGKLDAARVLARLPEMYRRVLALFYLEGRSYDEVAEMLGLPLGTVKSHLYRAKAAAAALIVGRRGPMMEESTPCGARTTRD